MMRAQQNHWGVLRGVDSRVKSTAVQHVVRAAAFVAESAAASVAALATVAAAEVNAWRRQGSAYS
eukprot:6469015-Amphidinium_carterae.1